MSTVIPWSWTAAPCAGRLLKMPLQPPGDPQPCARVPDYTRSWVYSLYFDMKIRGSAVTSQLDLTKVGA